MNHPIMFFDQDNKTKLVSASFSYFLKLERKIDCNLKSVEVFINNRFNLSIIKKLIKMFYLHRSCKKVVEKSNPENLKK